MSARPESAKPRTDLLIATLLAVIALPLLFLRGRYLRDWGDEGYFVGAALRTLDDQVLYSDFQHNYPPGRAFALAGLMAAFGRELGPVRAFWAAAHALAVGVAYLAARRMTPRWAAVLAALFVLFNPVHPNKSVELLLSAWILFVLFRTAEGRMSDFAAGLGLAAAGWLRHDVAVFGTLLFPLARLLAPLREGEPRAPLARLARAWPFALGVALGLAPLVLWLGANGALGSGVRELTLSGYTANKILGIPFPAPFAGFDADSLMQALRERLPFWVPPVTLAASLGLGLARLRSPERRTSGALFLVCALYGSLLFIQVLPRSDLGHLDKASVPTQLLHVGLIAVAVAALRRAATTRARLASAVALALAVPLAALLPFARGFDSRSSLPSLLAKSDKGVEVRAPHGTLWFWEGGAPEYQALFDALAPLAGREGETMVVYPAGATFNLLFDLPSPLRYDVLRPGELGGLEYGEAIPNNPRVLAEIDAVLEAAPPLVLWDTAEATNPEIQQRMLAFARRTGYRPLRAGPFLVFVRRD